MNRPASAADRLCRGSATLAWSCARRLISFVTRRRRPDLKGWRGLLDNALWSLFACGGLYISGYAVLAAPGLMWPATAVWCWRAWKAAPPPVDEPAEQAGQAPPEHDPEDVRDALLDWIRQAIGDRQGVHLRDLLTNARQHGMFEGLDVADFRAALEARGVPVRKRVRVRDQGVTVGVHRDDLMAPATAPSEPSPEAPSQDDQEPRLHVA